MVKIPPRAPIGDPFDGVVLAYGNTTFLALQPKPGLTVLYAPPRAHTEPLMVRYGIRLLEKPRFSIVPGLLALDYGEMLTGEAAWMFILKKSNLHPRADVVGYMNDGRDEMLPIKRLDLALAPEPLVYENAAATRPLATPAALIASEIEIQVIAPRILEYIPHYPSLTVWQEQHADSLTDTTEDTP